MGSDPDEVEWNPLSAEERRALEQASRVSLREPIQRRRHPDVTSGRGALNWNPDAADQVTRQVRRAVVTAPSHPLVEVLTQRRSRTSGLEPLDLADLVGVLYRSARVVDAGTGDGGEVWSLRPTPSAGAVHPFDLLVTAVRVRDLDAGHYVFGPNSVSLFKLAPEQNGFADALAEAIGRAARRSDSPPASICLVADLRRTGRRYEAPLSLVLRDAGALLATMHLVATDLGLRSGIVGTAGHFASDFGGDLHGSSRQIVDCGALVMGGSGG